ncbi:MAG: tetraacyldisaccharide 4'-kinase [Comamonadaceae bacterium]
MNTVAQQSALQRSLTCAWAHRGWLAWLLWPLSLLLGALASFRRGLFQLGLFRIGRLAVPVIVVGNVVVGGSGKTPVVMALVRHLQSCGHKVGVISRGYGRSRHDCCEVLPDTPVLEVGDEPALIQRNTGARVFVAPARIDAARALLLRHPDTDVIVCDDGLQHWGLHRDMEICVFDDRGIGNGFLLPAGPLRERWPRMVDLVLHTGNQPAFSGFRAQRRLAEHARRADGSAIALTDLTTPSTRPLLALAAIAKPEEFFAMLRAAGLKLARTEALPDHHDLISWAEQDHHAYQIICTEKDAVKLWRLLPDALAIPLQCTPEPDFIAHFDTLLASLLKERSKAALSSGHGHTTS